MVNFFKKILNTTAGKALILIQKLKMLPELKDKAAILRTNRFE